MGDGAVDSLLMRLAAGIAAAFLVLAPPVAAAAPAAPGAERTCPAVVAQATRLLVVTARGMGHAEGRARLFVRNSAAEAWWAEGPAFAVTLGRKGLGWAWDQTALAEGNEPVKREGDGKTPAGVFAAGAPFGLSPRDLAGYRRIDAPRAACVDDVKSPHYNAIVDASAVAAGHSFERMWEIGLYRQGIVVKHATSAPLAGGSCIFLHVWRAPGRPTAGCVAMPEAKVTALQDAFDGRRAAILIAPEAALPRLAACALPDL